MSKYEKLWNYIIENGKDEYEISFEEVKNILGFEIDHSFLNYKKEILNSGYYVEKVNMKDKKIIVKKTIKLSEDLEITDIRGSRWDCKVTFNNGVVLKCNGELLNADRFEIYYKGLNLTDEDKIIFKKLFEKDRIKHPDSFVYLV